MKINKIISITVFILFTIFSLIYYFNYSKTQKDIIVEEEKIENTSPDTLEKINNYQKKYFEIIKRHNALLNLTNDSAAIQDLEELKSLFQEVKNNIDKNNEYLIKYEKIKEEYKENTGETTLEMNDFALNKYNAFDKLLNDTYNKVKSVLPKENFEKLKSSQIAWLKDVNDYNNVFEQQGFGTIGTLIKLDYETNMRSFRTLLLMLYL